jgi:outer membrane protein OmpA-like peptidoglycan-associated protein
MARGMQESVCQQFLPIMKPCPFILFVSSALWTPAFAQAPLPPGEVVEEVVEVVPSEKTVTEETVTEVTPAESAPRREVTKEVVTEEVRNPRRLDAALARRQLSTVPRAIPAPGTTVERTETTTRKSDARPPRVYNRERNVVVVEGVELPYVTIPVLFKEGSDELLDDESRLAIEDTAKAIREIADSNPNARFDIEGHTSTEGSDEMNLDLSAKRARRVYDELTQRYRIPAMVLSAHGYGESYPNFPQGSEDQLVLDRRVLVVRLK